MFVVHVLGGQLGGGAVLAQRGGVGQAIPFGQVALAVLCPARAADVFLFGDDQAVDRAVTGAEVAGVDAALAGPVLARRHRRGAQRLIGLAKDCD
ncbi:hypothetical protein D3C71_1811210 [compost metagenome]